MTEVPPAPRVALNNACGPRPGPTPVAYAAATQMFRIISVGANIANLTDPTGGAASLLGRDDVFLVSTSRLNFGAGPVLITMLNQSETYTGLHPGTQAGTNFAIAIDPTDPNFVYVSGDRQVTTYSPDRFIDNSVKADNWVARIFRVRAVVGQNPAGQQQLIGTGAPIPAGDPNLANANPIGTSPHADSRFITFGRDGSLIEGDDGGIYRLSHPNGVGGSRFWQSLNGSLAIGEFSHVAYDPMNQVVIGGLQDVGNQAQLTLNQPLWQTVSAGDGNANLASVVPPAFPNPGNVNHLAIGNSLRGALQLQFNQTGQLTQITSAFQALAPALNSADGNRAFVQVQSAVSGFQNNQWAIGRFGLYETINNGGVYNNIATTNLVAALGPSGLLGRFFMRNANPEFGFVTALTYGQDPAAGNNQPIYVGLEFSNVNTFATTTHMIWVRDNAGNFVAGRQQIIGTGNARIVDIATDPTNWRVAYAVTSANRVFGTVDGGQNLTAVTGAAGTEIGALPRGLNLTSVEVVPVPAGDLKITDRRGNVVVVNLDGAATLANVKTLVEAQATRAGLNITLTIGATQLTLTDNGAGGAGHLQADALAGSDAPAPLGPAGLDEVA